MRPPGIEPLGPETGIEPYLGVVYGIPRGMSWRKKFGTKFLREQGTRKYGISSLAHHGLLRATCPLKKRAVSQILEDAESEFSL